MRYKINGAPKKFKNWLRPLFRPRTNHTCHRKPNPSRKTVTLKLSPAFCSSAILIRLFTHLFSTLFGRPLRDVWIYRSSCARYLRSQLSPFLIFYILKLISNILTVFLSYIHTLRGLFINTMHCKQDPIHNLIRQFL